MKLTKIKRRKVIKTLNQISGILEKCGGPGGKPGPCPSGSTTSSPSKSAEAAVKAMPEGSIRKGNSVGWHTKDIVQGTKRIDDTTEKLVKQGFVHDKNNSSASTTSSNVLLIHNRYNHKDGHKFFSSILIDGKDTSNNFIGMTLTLAK